MTAIWSNGHVSDYVLCFMLMGRDAAVPVTVLATSLPA